MNLARDRKNDSLLVNTVMKSLYTQNVENSSIVKDSALWSFVTYYLIVEGLDDCK
jgi:hypothetical protein